jgi:hypothetical protein
MKLVLIARIFTQSAFISGRRKQKNKSKLAQKIKKTQ